MFCVNLPKYQYGCEQHKLIDLVESELQTFTKYPLQKGGNIFKSSKGRDLLPVGNESTLTSYGFEYCPASLLNHSNP